MTYDTTFKLGDFYMSPLLFRHTHLDGSPVIRLGFLIHERKFRETHEFFFHEVRKEVPYFRSKQGTSIPLVTDDERALYEAAEGVLDNVYFLQCWNHLINSLKMWLRQHGASSQEIPMLLQQVWIYGMERLKHHCHEDRASKKAERWLWLLQGMVKEGEVQPLPCPCTRFHPNQKTIRCKWEAQGKCTRSPSPAHSGMT